MAQEARRYAYTSSSLDRDALEVVSFSGREALSELYAFDVVLVSKKDDLDLDQVIGAPAALTLHGKDGSFTYHGLACLFEQTGKVDDFTFYRARLVPKPYILTLNENYRIFLDKPVNVFLQETLQDEGLVSGLDFEFRLTKSYPQRPYVSQFRETSFAFASRWMERDGLYYFFEQGQSGAKMVITDAKAAHQPMKGKSEFRYETPSGLVQDESQEGVYDFIRRISPLPESVLLKDWNYETPSVDLKAQAPVLANGHGAMRLYGDHFKTIQEGGDLAKIRAQELLCRQDVSHGQSSFPGMTAGWLMSLSNHLRNALNREYLVTAVHHEGRQFGFLTSGLGLSHEPDGEEETFYRNAFTAIPSGVQYRPERKTPWPRLEGLMNAKIDGSGSGKYAEVDDQGRYKIIVAYDRSGRKDGKASKRVRSAQPYGGSNHGLHFPLHKGCEAVFACVDGDPDRPVILGAAPNPDNKSVITSENQTRVDLQTSGKNQLYFEDKEGSERALWQSKANQTFMRLGTPNDPPSWIGPADAEGQTGIALKTPENVTVLAGSMLSTYMIGYFDTILGLLQESYMISKTALSAGFVQEIAGYTFKTVGSETEIGAIATRLNGSETQVAANKTHLTDELIAARGRVTALDGEVNTLRQDTNRLSGECDDLAQDVTDLSQEKTDLSGDVSRLAQQKTELTQSNTVLSGEVQDLAQSKIDLHTEVEELVAEVNRLTQIATDLDEQRTELFTSISSECEEIMGVSDMDLTI